MSGSAVSSELAPMTITGRADGEPPQGSRGPAWLRRAMTRASMGTKDRVWIRYVAAAAVVIFVVGTSFAIIVNIQTGDADETSRTVLSYVGLAFVCFTCRAVPIPGIATVLYAMVIYCGYALNPLAGSGGGGAGDGVRRGRELAARRNGGAHRRARQRTKPSPKRRRRRAECADSSTGWRRTSTSGWRSAASSRCWCSRRCRTRSWRSPTSLRARSGMPFWRFYLAVAIGKTIRWSPGVGWQGSACGCARSCRRNPRTSDRSPRSSVVHF